MWGIVPFPLMKINFVYQNNVANYKRKRPPKWSNIFCEYLNIKMCVVDWTRALAGNSDLTLVFWKFCGQFNLECFFFRFSSISENLFSRCLNIRGSEPQDIGAAKTIGQFVLLLSHSVNAFHPLSHFRRYFVNTVTTSRQSHVTMLRRKHPFVDVLSHDTVITGRG